MVENGVQNNGENFSQHNNWYVLYRVLYWDTFNTHSNNTVNKQRIAQIFKEKRASFVTGIQPNLTQYYEAGIINVSVAFYYYYCY